MKSFHTLYGRSYWKSDFLFSILRVGENFYFPFHAHDYIEICYVAEGRGFHYIEDERVQVERGDLFIIPIGSKHIMRPDTTNLSHPLIIYNCILDPSLLDRLRSIPGFHEEFGQILKDTTKQYHLYKDSHLEIRKYIEKIFMEYSLRQNGYEAAICGLLVLLLVTLNRQSKLTSITSKTIEQMELVLMHISIHYNELLSLEELAGLIPISSSYFQKLFKRITGQSLTEYLQNIRIDRSCELLLDSQITIKDIAVKVGYADVKFYRDLFKKKTGLTPQLFRKLNLSNQSNSFNHSN